MRPAALAVFATVARFSVVSMRKQMFKAADSSGLSGGQSRVFTFPGRGAFAITVKAHVDRLVTSG